MDDLFEYERNIEQDAILHLNEIQNGAPCDGEKYATLTKEYTKLLKQLGRMTKMSDRITEALNKSTQEAKAASRAKSAFLANMSHEIRTPINTILGMNEMILRESDSPEVLEYAASVRNASTTLLSIINGILDLSKIESGKMDIIPVEYETGSFLNDLVNMIGFMAENKGLAFHVEVAEDLPSMLCGDEIRLKQCAVNVLTNAVKYTHEGSVTMCLTWERTGEDTLDLIFEARDTGIGIKEEDMDKLFSSFQRIEEKRNRNIEGTGLGMNIVVQILELMGSKLEVESVYGEGSTFRFRVAQKILSEDPIGDYKAMYENALQEKNDYQARFTAPRAKVLIVDDNDMNLKVARALLKQTKIQVVTANSGMECLEMVKRERFDIIFTDHMMPVMDGIDTLHALKAQTVNLCRDVPVVVLTANAISGARENYLNEGFHDYLSKPIDPKELERMIQRLLPPELVEQEDEAPPEAKAEEPALPSIEGIDMAEAVLRSGGREMLFQMFGDFVLTMPGKIELIERYLAEERLKDYTIEVHSLKSAARIVGAMELSAQAEYLERCGNGGRLDELWEKTPALLETYRRIGEGIKPYAGIEEVSESDKQDIGGEELAELLILMRESAEVFDIDALDAYIKEMGTYRLPGDAVALYEKLKICAANVDMAGGIELLDQMLSCFVI